jgi:UDP-GlcNAc3NAcA epimerase
MVLLETYAKLISTDSGGVQKEAYFAETPCITLREETEWVELVEHGYNRVAGSDSESICRAYEEMVGKPVNCDLGLYGEGKTGDKIVGFLTSA